MKKPLVLAIILIFAFSSASFAGVVKRYFPNGKLYSVQVYYPDGRIKGPYKIYWENGRLKQKTTYRNGRPYSIQNWSQNGARWQNQKLI